MKKLSRSLILSLTLLLGLTTVACNQDTTNTTQTDTQTSSPTSQAVGVIDTVPLLRNSIPGKAAIAYLENLQADAIARLTPLEEKLNIARENDNEEEFKAIAMQMQSIAGEFQETLKIQQEIIFGAITKEITKLIDVYRAEKNITVIFNTTDLISYDESADISEDIMVEFNKVTLDYQAIVEEAFASVEAEALADEPTEAPEQSPAQ